jgi:hypothetical protein
VAQEQFQQQELGLGQLDHPLAATDLVRDRIQGEVAVAQHLALPGAVTRAAQQRPQPGLQLAQRERLDEVVVGADVKPFDAVIDGVPGGEHEHRGAIAPLA